MANGEVVASPSESVRVTCRASRSIDTSMTRSAAVAPSLRQTSPSSTRHAEVLHWAPVDPVAEESTLEFLAGSHLEGWRLPRTFMDEQAKWFPEGSLAELPDVEDHREDYRIVRWSLQPGDAVFFHMLTLHHAYGVPGTSRRRAFSLRFLGDDAVHAPRAWTTSPPFDALDRELPAGASMDHPLFPLLRQESGS